MNRIKYCIIIFLIVLTSCGAQKNKWYRLSKIDNRTYIISEPESSQNNSCFLIMGSKEAILFDAGTGENKDENLSQIIGSLTNLPLTVLLSHFHFDHIGNISDFNSIGIPEIPVLKDKISVDSLLYLTNKETLSKKTLTLKVSRFFPLETDIDLGNRKIKILHTPGHSNESISIIDNENGYIFAGDLIYNDLLLLNDCDAYVNSIDRLIESSDPKYRVFGSHGNPEVDYQRIFKIKAAIDSYRKDRGAVQPFRQINFFGSTKDLYKIEEVYFINGYEDAFINE